MEYYKLGILVFSTDTLGWGYHKFASPDVNNFKPNSSELAVHVLKPKTLEFQVFVLSPKSGCSSKGVNRLCWEGVARELSATRYWPKLSRRVYAIMMLWRRIPANGGNSATC